MVDFDEALAILENPTRRQILRRLVKEPHYPLQLSELLDVSQQAVVKHLRVLEESGFVDSERVPSEKGGPPKKMYTVNQSFSLRLDLGPDLFRAEHRSIPSGGPMRLSNRLPPELDGVVDRLGTRRKLPMVEAMGVLSELDSALERIDGHRDAVIALHQQVMKKVSPSISEQSGTYEERQLAHAMMSHPRRPLDLDAFSQGLRIQSMHAEEMMETLRERLMRDFAANQGRLVAAREGTPLPWWLAR
ncbi:MAG: helix-turn-helix domain-containing protein [Candidatus Thermoplasmatota archaeon]|nr:helix-turn-helix domain-containing protein [Candidatus Thalassarchaeum sp.]MDP6920731.1 helix-turn-helix domain-containing protein [Candidatus Thalassarchaeum sp.]MED5158733.1 helix-turn-helix domain-containing protein [Candidatus Thermoplasmatota archaeon]MEE2606222.1 helix-turn-helix domain-containing protein [Candidatus Thermoplasmatota archaeon]MEE3277913.1 helix-turn-helix domain-containing protein [Candidatus Thermoplasmatota archaeon]